MPQVCRFGKAQGKTSKTLKARLSRLDEQEKEAEAFGERGREGGEMERSRAKDRSCG